MARRSRSMARACPRIWPNVTTGRTIHALPVRAGVVGPRAIRYPESNMSQPVAPAPRTRPSLSPVTSAPVAFRPVPRTGVIYVTTEAGRLGFDPNDPNWCNLGQGMPEAGPLPGAPPRHDHVTIAAEDQEYSPIAGLWELREAIADLYN